jgi:hypothetical protein
MNRQKKSIKRISTLDRGKIACESIGSDGPVMVRSY